MAAMVAKIEEDGVALSSLSLEHIVLQLRMIIDQCKRFMSLTDVVMSFTQQLHGLQGIEPHSNSTIVNSVRTDIMNQVNQIVVSGSNGMTAATARETMAVITLAAVEDQIFHQLF